MEAPSGKLGNPHLSIKKMLEKRSIILESGESELRHLPREQYTLDDFKMEWRKFAFTMKNEGKETIYNAMIKRDAKRIGDDDYLLEVDNQIQIDYIQPLLSELLGHLRKGLKNYDVDVRLEITKNPDKEVKFQTGKDKFAALSRKNPNLHTLKNTFNLDIEY